MQLLTLVEPFSEDKKKIRPAQLFDLHVLQCFKKRRLCDTDSHSIFWDRTQGKHTESSTSPHVINERPNKQ